MVLNAPVQFRDKQVNVVFVLNTGSPYTYLSQEALTALGLKENFYELEVKINGVPHYIKAVPSDAQFEGVSLLGADFLEDIDSTIKSDRATRTFSLHVGQGAVPSALC
jgi:hypothetical protein